MASAWLLPEHIADVLPSQARRIEELRRDLLDLARTYGCELVMPPMLEHLESLLTGTGRELDLKTFKLVDQLSGRSLGLRADTTPQVARIDAHLLNRAGVTRLCYCGPVVHTRPEGLHGSREPLQFGVEIYGHAGLEADLEVQELAIATLHKAGLTDITLDLGDARLVQGVLGELKPPADTLEAIVAALAAKDAASLAQATAGMPEAVSRGLQSLIGLYGGMEVLDLAREQLPDHPLIRAALDDLRWLSSHLRQCHPDLRLGFDLADLRGYAYYSGMRFALYAAGCSDAILRGGRYDEVGAVFGRKRPAVGFSLDLKELVACVAPRQLVAAIRAPWGMDAGLRQVIAALRTEGHTVVCVLPGHEHEVDEFLCDRELVPDTSRPGGWAVRPL